MYVADRNTNAAHARSAAVGKANGVGGAVGHGCQPLESKFTVFHKLGDDFAVLEVVLPLLARLRNAVPPNGFHVAGQLVEHGLREHFADLDVVVARVFYEVLY